MNPPYGDSIEVMGVLPLSAVLSQLCVLMNIKLLMNKLSPFIYLKDYEVQGMLGKGGFAQVFKAKSKKNGCEVAIKRVR